MPNQESFQLVLSPEKLKKQPKLVSLLLKSDLVTHPGEHTKGRRAALLQIFCHMVTDGISQLALLILASQKEIELASSMNKHRLENALKVRKYNHSRAHKHQSSFINAELKSTFIKGKLN